MTALLIGTGLLTLMGLVILFLIRQSKGQSAVWMKQEIEALRSDFKDSLNNLMTHISERLRDSSLVLGQRLDNTENVVGSVKEHLVRLHEASTRIFEVGKDISGLQELLRAPKLRGGIGEFFLADILSQIMPKGFYQTPYGFRNGQLVDAVIKFGKNIVPIDAKFPLENFRAMLSCQDEEDKRVLRRQFIADVKKHIFDISSKYILPDEGTFDFALMYIPAENVYYETIIKDEKFPDNGGLFQYSLSKKVIPVSPNSFYAYLQVILLGLKGMAVEKDTQQIIASLARLKGDLDRFYEEFARLGRHIANSKGSFDDAEKRLARLQEKFLRLGGLKEKEALPDGEKVGI